MERRKTHILDTVDDCGNEIDLTPLINKFLRGVWAVLGLGCLAGVIFAGAYWHLLTFGICAVMYLSLRGEENRTK